MWRLQDLQSKLVTLKPWTTSSSGSGLEVQTENFPSTLYKDNISVRWQPHREWSRDFQAFRPRWRISWTSLFSRLVYLEMYKHSYCSTVQLSPGLFSLGVMSVKRIKSLLQMCHGFCFSCTSDRSAACSSQCCVTDCLLISQRRRARSWWRKLLQLNRWQPPQVRWPGQAADYHVSEHGTIRFLVLLLEENSSTADLVVCFIISNWIYSTRDYS